MEQYTDLRILDCNRRHSVQGQSGNNENNALFTNELGEGVRLNVGDQISIQGAFISEVGAGADTIEFKGNNLVSASGITLTKKFKYTYEQERFPSKNWDLRYQNILGGYQAKYSQNIETEARTLKDNECTIATQFYTTNNGTGYMFLPRRFAYDQNYNGFNSSNVIGAIWEDIDKVDSGHSFFYPKYQAICEDDYQFVRDGESFPALSQYPKGHYIPRHDNKRFTILRRMGTTYYQSQIYKYDGDPDEVVNPPDPRNPSFGEYDYYINLIDIKVNAGFNSPSDISEQITDQLKKNSKPDYQYEVNDLTGKPQLITNMIETNTWKPFTCASYLKFGFQAYRDYVDSVVSNNGMAYYSAYENIAVKRPDLFLLGRKTNASAGHAIYNAGGLPLATRTTNTIKTSFRFPEDLVALSNLFKAQANYPELFSGRAFEETLTNYDGSQSVDNCRFLHMNSYTSASQGGLGNDGYSDTNNASHFNYNSIPVFFYYNKANENKLTDGSDANDLAYGFATSYINASFGFNAIEFHPEKIGGMTEFQYSNWVSNASGYVPADIEFGRQFGWDYHFSAYSTLAMIPYSGRMDRDYSSINEWAIQNASQKITGGNSGNSMNISDLITKTYIGANDPLFSFDAVSSRFNFSLLHTPEKAGQTDILAGLNQLDAPQINPKAGESVYKINPRFNQYEYTPDLKPYKKDMNAKCIWFPAGNGITTNASDIQSIPIMSRQVSPFTIFDANSGIFITDFGYDENTFNKGLWGILGFTYNQFNASLSPTLNRLTRINDNNKNELNITTTNCEVVSSQTLNYNVNQFGAVFYTNQISVPQVQTGANRLQGAVNHGLFVDGVESVPPLAVESVPVFPPISIKVDSIKIKARNLPRKMLRPYYLIRSDIIETPKYIGADKSLMPVVGLCDKQYSGGDFYFGSDNEFVFRITKPRTITSITTSIHDPDGTFSRCNEDSAVIYKLIKNISADTNILAEIMGKKKSK